MTGYWLANLKDMVAVRGKAAVQEELSRFCCPLNPDVEFFLRERAVLFMEQGYAATHLVYCSYKDCPVLVGYFALANKFATIKSSQLTSRWRHRINQFSIFEPDSKSYYISLPLIGQLGKNYGNGYNKLITGDQLLTFACNKVSALQSELSGKMVYLECEDKPSLISFYQRNNFYAFGKRNLDKDEIGHDETRYLVQMIRYL